jgi:hypothetical protein
MHNSRLLLRLSFALAMIMVSAVSVQAQIQRKVGDVQKGSFGVSFSGKVVSIVGDYFIRDDGTGQIIVDAGPSWWHQIDLSPGEQVTVVGELGRGESDAFPTMKGDGSVIEIKGPGKPSWAGGGRSGIVRFTASIPQAVARI